MVLLLGAVLLYSLTGDQSFSSEEGLGDYFNDHRGLLTLIFALLVGGLAVKAAMVPLQGWLPRAMVAPAPVSALPYAVAVVKAGPLEFCGSFMTFMVLSSVLNWALLLG